MRNSRVDLGLISVSRLSWAEMLVDWFISWAELAEIDNSESNKTTFLILFVKCIARVFFIRAAMKLLFEH